MAAPRTPPRKNTKSHFPGWGTVLDICTELDSNFGTAAVDMSSDAEVIRITKEDDWSKQSTVQRILKIIKSKPGASAHASLPCTMWSNWQKMALHKFGAEFAATLSERRKESRVMV